MLLYFLSFHLLITTLCARDTETVTLGHSQSLVGQFHPLRTHRSHTKRNRFGRLILTKQTISTYACSWILEQIRLSSFLTPLGTVYMEWCAPQVRAKGRAQLCTGEPTSTCSATLLLSLYSQMFHPLIISSEKLSLQRFLHANTFKTPGNFSQLQCNGFGQ